MGTVLDYLDNTCLQYPNKTAFSDLNESISFSELRKKSQAFGTFIKSNLSLSEKGPILVILEKSVQEIICFLGVLYSGNYYCAADTSLPDLRIQSIIIKLNPVAIITNIKEKERVAGIIEDMEIRIPVYHYDEYLFENTDDKVLVAIRDRAIDTDPLCVFFTSGTTGVPKGVCINHRSVISFIDVYTRTFGITETDVIGNQSVFDFSASIKDIYTTMKTGATTHIIPIRMFSIISNVVEYLHNNNITTLSWSVSAVCMIANAKAFESITPMSIKKVLFTGDVMPIKQLNYWVNHLPDVLYVNLYGPSEIAGNCLYYVVDRQFEDHEALPLGRTFENADVLALKEDGSPISINEVGEIYIKGSNLSPGYYNAPELTVKSFIQNPLNSNYPEIVYKTGDLAKLNDIGELVFISRKDHQIKHLGHRIELGEIEAMALTHLELSSACCLYHKEKSMIWIFYTGLLDNKELALYLRKRLPSYMIPMKFRKLDKLPYLVNGKIDRSSLKTLMEG